ncbi:MAG: quinone oxidoreductase [Ignavibacteria bacterium GWF2_33_9]|nr:MAG: quinone oxidoreductase [Ignavibacteria bacterium GWF2_33_9]
MENLTFKSLIINENSEGNFSHNYASKTLYDLPAGEVVIQVKYSALNYKDALVFRGHKGISGNYPQTPGIDAAGIVYHSDSPDFKVGDSVIVTGYDLGMNTSGGFQEFIRVPSNWVVPLPEKMTLKEAMVLGTAGFTAALAIHRLQTVGIFPDSGPILVTGATGAVGVCAISILNKIGYKVSASSGKPELYEFLNQIGADEIFSREEILDDSPRPLLRRRWKGVIENVGGKTLESVVKATDKEGAITVIGILSGDNFSSTLYPFILRGIALLGIESAETEYPLRKELWSKLSNEWRIVDFNLICREISFDQIPDELAKMLQGKQSKKIVVRIS